MTCKHASGWGMLGCGKLGHCGTDFPIVVMMAPALLSTAVGPLVAAEMARPPLKVTRLSEPVVALVRSLTVRELGVPAGSSIVTIISPVFAS